MYSWVELKHIAEWCRVPLSIPNARVSGVSTDTRSVKPGEVFVALKGSHFDGHRFLADARSKGAAIAIVSEKSSDPIAQIVVPDPLHALAAIGAGLRQAFNGLVLAVTGSAGKSSTKDMAAKLLGTGTLASPASFNNLLGVSKTLCLIHDTTKTLMLEMGMNAPGEIAELCRYFNPQVGAITNIGDAHLGFLGSQRNIMLAKRELFEHLQTSGKGVAVNIDQPMVRLAYDATLKDSNISKIFFSCHSAKADVWVREVGVEPSTGKLSIELTLHGQVTHHEVPMFGTHHAENLACAVALALLAGVSAEDLRARVATLSPAAHRGEVHRLEGDRLLVDESYNANPSAMKSSLQSVTRLDEARRRFLVLGEMRELGEFADKKHEELAQLVKDLHDGKPYQTETVWVGKVAKAGADRLRKIARLGVSYCETWEDAKTLVAERCLPGDILYFKGSNGIKLYLAVDEIKKQWPVIVDN